jgi:hypothetical protein
VQDGEQANTVTIREQALALESHPAQIHKWRARGMPAELGPAQAWLQANVKRRRGAQSTMVDVVPPPAVNTDDPDELRDAKWLARRAFDEAAKASPVLLPQLVTAYHRACAAIAEIERALVARELDAQTLMHRDQVMAIMAAESGKLRALLENMPAAVAPQANPADPELAAEAIRDHVESILAAMSGGIAS